MDALQTPSADLQLSSEEALIVRIIRETIPVQASALDHFVQWLRSQLHTNEKVPAALQRLGILTKAGTKELAFVEKGYMQANACEHLFCAGFPALWLSISQPSVSPPAPPVPQAMGEITFLSEFVPDEEPAKLPEVVNADTGRLLDTSHPQSVSINDPSVSINDPVSPLAPQTNSVTPENTKVITSSSFIRSLPMNESTQQPFSPDVLVNTNIAGYRIKSVLGKGPRGAVYSADDIALERTIAIKILNPDLVVRNPNWATRFFREASLASKFEHPHLLNIYAIGQHEQYVYAAMPLVQPGAALDLLRAKGPLLALYATRLTLQCVRFLQEAHSRHIVHGNLKPSNVLIDSQGQARVCDLQLPLPLEHTGVPPAPTDNDYQDDFRLLAAMYHWLLTGRPPVSDLVTASGRSIGLVRADGPAAPIPSMASQFIQRALSPDRRAGYATATEVWEALRSIEEALSGSDTVSINPDDALSNSLRESVGPYAQHSGPPVQRIPVLNSPSSRAPSSNGTPVAARQNNLEIGQVLGKCLLTEHVGRGSTGIVFRALHQTLNVPVALKVLNMALAKDDPSIYRQFKSESRLLAQLNHPHIVRVWDFEDNLEMPYLVLEYVEGLSLAELVHQSGRLRSDRATQVILHIADGLNAAHKLGIVHRDVKPANILLARDGNAKLADLGLAIFVNSSIESRNVSAKEGAGFAGTVAYMAPEQAAPNGSVDHRSDIYALGTTFYHIVTGQLPFNGRTRLEVLMKHAREAVVPPHELIADIPLRLSGIIQKMMAKDPKQRFQSYPELMDALQRIDEPTVAESRKAPRSDPNAAVANRGPQTPGNPSDSVSDRYSVWKTIFRMKTPKSGDAGPNPT